MKPRRGKGKRNAEIHLPPPPPRLFPNYPSPSSTSSTPLPPPSMPRKPFLRRILPLVLVGCTAYMYMRTTKNHGTEKEEKFGVEVIPITAQGLETSSQS
ncbi:hypothetical protein ZIOFF_003996 [Zingiber officinale]|uniref:Uncharacterized protein n=1 Tax=Zingiber officinale TaxID=94328 RepID=A0A8J5MAX7_ZINOF|nr:hypothetical protein ZIOFF_003996 [Zingiber officinale]